MIEWFVKLELKSPNVQGHWSKRYKRDQENKLKIILAWKLAKKRPKAPCIVHIHRMFSGKQKPMDYDSYTMSLKGVRDSIANLLIPGLAHGQADDEKRGLIFLYQQSKETISGVKIIFEDLP